jgi:hypothetical protein
MRNFAIRRWLRIVAILASTFCAIAADPSPAPTSMAAGPLLVGMWKGFVPSLQTSVFISWVQPKSASSEDVGAALNAATALTIPRLPADYAIYIVNMIMVSATNSSTGANTSERGFIFVREHDGHWSSLDDSKMYASKAEKGDFVDKVLAAGLPRSPGVDGGVRVMTPLATPTPKP